MQFTPSNTDKLIKVPLGILPFVQKEIDAYRLARNQAKKQATIERKIKALQALKQ